MSIKYFVTLLSIIVLAGCITSPQHPAQTGKQEAIKPEQPETLVSDYVVNQLESDIFRIDVHGLVRRDTILPGRVGRNSYTLYHRNSRTDMDIVSYTSLVRAAEITLSSGYSYFRILDSWDDTILIFYPEMQKGNAFQNSWRTIIIKFTEDPNDMEAQWVLYTIGPQVGFSTK